MVIKKIIKNIIILRFLIIVVLFLLPYYIFEGKLYLGGDDTRLFYSYPIEFLTNVSFFSWYKVSSLGINGPSQYIVPFLSFWSILSLLITSKVTLNYLAFSLPLILGFIYFQLAFKELFQTENKSRAEILLGSLFYVLSPILIINQMFVFLISIWLLGLIPIIIYYFLKFYYTSKFKYVLISSVWCFFLAFAIYAIPWLIGFVLPVLMGLIVSSFLFKDKWKFIKKLVVYLGFITGTQAFWLSGFISTYLNLGQDSFASKFLSKGFVDTFTPTILSTATGNIFYPLLNLFHRQISLDFNWKLKDVFVAYYDKTLFLNFLYIVILIAGVISFRKYLGSRERKIFILLLITLLFSLYFFTVNIGILKDLFIILGKIPGFTMFRNFYDKFAPGYVIIYSSVITLCLILFTRKIEKRRNSILAFFFLTILINAIPIKKTVNSPLWTTDSIYKNISLPYEYLSFMEEIKKSVSNTNNILSIPFGSSVYTVIKDNNSNNAYVGVSPVKIFSGVNDISGHLSFNYTKEADVVDGLLINRKYSEFQKILYEHNINYILQTKNIPSELINSYVFNSDLYSIQDNTFLSAVTEKKIIESTNGNYVLYKTKKLNSLINIPNSYFKKISEVKYIIYVKNISSSQDLFFADSFHAGWNLYVKKSPLLPKCTVVNENQMNKVFECWPESKLFELSDLKYSFESSPFENSQALLYGFANKWKIDPKLVKSNFSDAYYKVNKDGSIDMELILYFTPQNYFYVGILISALIFSIGIVYLLFVEKYEKAK